MSTDPWFFGSMDQNVNDAVTICLGPEITVICFIDKLLRIFVMLDRGDNIRQPRQEQATLCDDTTRSEKDMSTMTSCRRTPNR